VMERVIKVEMSFYSNRGLELGAPRRVAGGADADSLFQFQLYRVGGGTKHCQKMKRRQRTRLDSMEIKCDTER
jgi:hypothetical protein